MPDIRIIIEELFWEAALVIFCKPARMVVHKKEIIEKSNTMPWMARPNPNYKTCTLCAQ